MFLDDIEKEYDEKDKRKKYNLDDFVYDARDERYWDLANLTDYSNISINALIPKNEWATEDLPGRNGSVRTVSIKPSSSLARIEHGTVVECTTWWPGMPRIIKNILVTTEGDCPAPGVRMLNIYQAPTHNTQGNSAMAALWVEHVRKLWPDDAEVLLDYFAHTIQHPEEKINFGIVMLGEQGIGKDSALEPVRFAIGERNCAEISPDDLFSQYNQYVSSILVVVNEARPVMEDFKATDLYERLKMFTAAPPNWITMNGKYQRKRTVRNLMRIIITTNDPLALYVPENDRRLHFANSRVKQKWAGDDYFTQLHNYYEAGGYAHIYAYLLQRDISKFNPKVKPESNTTHKSIVASWNSPIHDPLSDVLDDLGWPIVFFGNELLTSEVASFDNKDEVKLLLKSSRKLASIMNRHGYEMVQSPDRQSGWRWQMGKKFRARVAFVRRDFEGNVGLQIDLRGKEIASDGRAARPKVVWLKPEK